MEPALNAAPRLGAAAEVGGPDDTARPSSAISAVFLQLLPRIATSMPRNEVACVLRLLCKAAAAALRGPQHATVHLSEPAPPAEFRWRWCGPQSLRSTTFNQRQQLEELTARSGVVANLAALEARGDLPLLSRPTSEWGRLLEEAAGAGRLELCRCLHEEWGVALSAYCLDAAAAGGHMDVCEWLLVRGRGTWWTTLSVCLAFEHGHVQLAERLLQLRPHQRLAAGRLVQTAARGCDLATLQRLHAEHVASRGLDLTGWQGADCLAAAAGSPTPDWAAKVEWLEGLGCLQTYRACVEAARCPNDSAARLAWLHARGYPVNADSALAAAEAGQAPALRYVLAQGYVHLEPRELSVCVDGACIGGSLEAVQALWDAGGRPDGYAILAAARQGHLHIVVWLAGQLGDGAVLTADLFRAAAASSCSLPLLRWLHERDCPWDASTMEAAAKAGSSKGTLEWLHERGCPWDARTFEGAAWAGSEEVLEWLAEHGCPMGEGGEAYLKAAESHDLPTLRCLTRLGCPFAPDGSTFTASLRQVLASVESGYDFDSWPLEWLLKAGCPVDWDRAVALAHSADAEYGIRVAADWLEGERQKRACVLPESNSAAP